MDTIIVVLLSAYIILILYNPITSNLVIPIVLAVIYFICLFLDKEDTTKVKLINLATILPILTLSIIASIKKFM